MISHSDLLTKELLEAFFVGEPRAWRLRQVTQITPLTPESYRARTSYQFRLTSGLVREAWWGVFHGVLGAPASPHREIEVIVPIDYLPKYVLLDFSLEDSAGKPLVLLTSGDTTAISFEVVRVAMTVLDERCADGAQRAEQFFNDNWAVLFALVATGQREIPARLERLQAFPTLEPSEFDYCYWMMAFFGEALEQYTGRQQLEPAIRDLCRTRLQEIYREIDRAGFELKEIVAGKEGYRDPLLNPALLVVDHLKASPEIAPEALGGVLDDFLSACRGFISTLLQLAYDERRFSKVVTVLRRMGHYYVAYSRMKVPLDRDFVVKMEQIVRRASAALTWRATASGLLLISLSQTLITSQPRRRRARRSRTSRSLFARIFATQYEALARLAS